MGEFEATVDDVETNDAGSAPENVTDSAIVRKAFGKALSEYPNAPSEIDVPFSYEKLGRVSDIPKDEILTEKQILQAVNAKRSAAARAVAVNAALAVYDIKAPALSAAEKAENKMVSALTLMGTPEAEARQMVKAMLANTPKGRS